MVPLILWGGGGGQCIASEHAGKVTLFSWLLYLSVSGDVGCRQGQRSTCVGFIHQLLQATPTPICRLRFNFEIPADVDKPPSCFQFNLFFITLYGNQNIEADDEFCSKYNKLKSLLLFFYY